MKNDRLERMLRMIPAEEPCAKIFDQVLSRIEETEYRRCRIRASCYGLLALSASTALIPAVSYVLKSLKFYGFSEYASLLMTDGSYVLSHWKSLMMSLVSVLPLNESIVSLALIGVFIYSVRRIQEDQSILHAHSHHFFPADRRIS